ncbi:putative DNA-binding protein [[Clostridium] ultunense Esp]|uniref:helix-turn-helix domain-containing protein n=1 Tax=Thermicanus aegyptius TaxID=94009 RepID=UPI0002B70B15|nr:helix-turn-helix domain-containing protein [Thermicanus aegyptius]CCQ98559.1 putative DNA-binding protein [[Clostridium] ultunense Esp]
MGELGLVLKKRREEKHLTLDDLQEITKIQKRYIDAIEKGNYHLLPGPFYTRAFIRNLAETLSLNPDQLLEQYESELPSVEPEPLETIPRRRRSLNRPSIFGPWITKVLLFLFVLIILFIIYMFIVRQFPAAPPQEAEKNPPQVQENFPKTSSPTSNQTGTNGGGAASVNEGGTSPAPSPAKEPILTFVKEEGKTSYYQISNVDYISLQVSTPRGPCWMEVRKGKKGKVIYSATLPEKQEMKWEFTDSNNAYIRLGATQNVDVTVNGKPVSLAGKKDVYRLDITLVGTTSATP